MSSKNRKLDFYLMYPDDLYDAQEKKDGAISDAGDWPVAEVLDRCCERPVDVDAWREFVRRFHPTICTSVLKAYKKKSKDEQARLPHVFQERINDLVQAVYTRLIESDSRALKNFAPGHPDSIQRYLALISFRVVANHFRMRRRTGERLMEE